MPHLQIRVKPVTSPANLDGVLAAIAAEHIDIKGIGGSFHETEGEVGLLLLDEDIATVLRALTDAHYEPREVMDEHGLHADIVEHREGGLLEAMARARAHHPTGLVVDIAVGLDDMTLLRAPDGRILAEGETETGAVEVTGKPLQVYFNVPVRRDDEGVVIP